MAIARQVILSLDRGQGGEIDVLHVDELAGTLQIPIGRPEMAGAGYAIVPGVVGVMMKPEREISVLRPLG
jgi:hypothetical protein